VLKPSHPIRKKRFDDCAVPAWQALRVAVGLTTYALPPEYPICFYDPTAIAAEKLRQIVRNSRRLVW